MPASAATASSSAAQELKSDMLGQARRPLPLHVPLLGRGGGCGRAASIILSFEIAASTHFRVERELCVFFFFRGSRVTGKPVLLMRLCPEGRAWSEMQPVLVSYASIDRSAVRFCPYVHESHIRAIGGVCTIELRSTLKFSGTSAALLGSPSLGSRWGLKGLPHTVRKLSTSSFTSYLH